MESIKSNLPLKKMGIESSTKERCSACGYGMRITMVVNGEQHSYCKYCEDQKLVEGLNVSKTQDEKVSKAMRAKSKHFTRIPDELQDVMLNTYKPDTPEQKDAKNIAIDFVMNFDKEKSLVYSGDPGVGKSHIAASIHKALEQDYSSMFIKSTEVLGLIKDSYSGANHTEKDIFSVCKGVDLLIIDDMGAEYDKASENESWASDILFRILDSRLGKSTVITTNYNETGIEDKFGLNGKRIVSRMNDKAEKIRIKGKDWRK